MPATRPPIQPPIGQLQVTDTNEATGAIPAVGNARWRSVRPIRQRLQDFDDEWDEWGATTNASTVQFPPLPPEQLHIPTFGEVSNQITPGRAEGFLNFARQNYSADAGALDNPADVWATEDDTAVPNWHPEELKKKKIKETKVVIVDKETIEAISNITNELIEQYISKLKNIYEKRLDFVTNLKYNDLIHTYDYDDEEGNLEQETQQRLRTLVTNFDNVLKSRVIMTHQDFGSYFSTIEAKAKALYDIEHSIYKYYPRLKSQVKYGNAELLRKILTVTQLGKGRVVCK